MKDKQIQINIKIRNLMKKAKETWIQDKCNVINEDMSKGRANKKAYKTLKILTKSTKKKTMIILDFDTWTEYCEDLYNYKIRPDNKLLKKIVLITTKNHFQ